MTGRNRGHTLLELLVALVVFALVAATGYTGLSQMSRARAAAEVEAERLAQLQFTISRLEQDLVQAIDASWRDGAGQRQPALQGSERTVQLVHAGWFNPRGAARSDLQPVRWLWQGRQLRRQSPLTDPALMPLSDGPSATTLDITALEFSFLDHNQQWQPGWPLAGPPGRNEGLPRAVRVRMNLAGFGALERVVELPGPRS